MDQTIDQSVNTPDDLTLTAREYHFDFASALARNRYWHSNNPVITHFFNALQATFPEGERFFIDSARDAVAKLGEENLAPGFRSNVKSFIKQEAFHGREHEAWVNGLAELGYDEVSTQMEQLKQLRLWARKNMPMPLRIAATAGGEHYTASLADLILLRRPELLETVDEPFRQALLYHSLEEIEHKAVCFDLFNAVSGTYWLRAFGLIMTAVDIMRLTRKRHIYFLKQDGLWNWKNRLAAWRFIWGRKGLATAMIPYTFKYLRPGFHPWKTDEREAFDRRYGSALLSLPAPLAE